MNFYRQQDQARQQSIWLVGLFSLAVISLILLTNLCVAVFVWYSDPSSVFTSHPDISQATGIDKLMAILQVFGWGKFIWVSVLVSGVILMAMLFKWTSLKQGGAQVAESLGAKRILPNSDEPKQRQLLNIVEEMALASGVPVPPVYVMQDELGINAFAAGLGLKDAVISVSQGALVCLNREQLQGVVAHEFSHIFNGDMRLNLRMVAVLHGILMIGEAGRTALHWGFSSSHRRSYRRSNRKQDGGMLIVLAFGLALTILGWLGQFFGAVIKSALSRQREFLADASAVQFTRNPDGIGGALRVIAGHSSQSLIEHNSAHEMGHLFFSQAYRGRWFATHPPLDDRIRKILPAWQGGYLEPESVAETEGYQDPMHRMRDQFATVTTTGLASSSADAQSAGQSSGQGVGQGRPATVVDVAPFPSAPIEHPALSVSEGLAMLPANLQQMAHEPAEVGALILMILMRQDAGIVARQKELLLQHDLKLFASIETLLPTIATLDLRATLLLLEAAMPALKSLSQGQYLQLRKLMVALIQADGRVELLEWVIFELVRQHGDRHFSLQRERRLKYKTPTSVSKLFGLVLSRLVYVSTAEDQQQKAFDRACNAAGLYNSSLLPLAQCSGASFTRAVHELSRCYPLLKPRLIKALILAVHADQQLDAQERALVTVIALIWDCPLIGIEG